MKSLKFLFLIALVSMTTFMVIARKRFATYDLYASSTGNILMSSYQLTSSAALVDLSTTGTDQIEISDENSQDFGLYYDPGSGTKLYPLYSSGW